MTNPVQGVAIGTTALMLPRFCAQTPPFSVSLSSCVHHHHHGAVRETFLLRDHYRAVSQCTEAISGQDALHVGCVTLASQG